jgi:uncharacterized damage-inducible protein DinB
MTILEQLSKELESEALTTRKMLQRVPNDKFGWAPHEKSMTIKRLATHIAELPAWISMALNTSQLDFSDHENETVDINDNNQLLEYFEKNLVDGRNQLAKASTEQLDEPWTLRNGAEVYSTNPKGEVLRMSISQTIHHRAQLGVYLR